MNNLKEDVVIVGAGPIGLLLGCWLRKLGVSVRILEKRMTCSTQSKATSMNAYSLTILHALGLYDTFEAAGKRVQDLHLYWQQKRLMRVNYRRLSSKYNHILCLEQPKTEALLESHFLAAGGRLDRGVEVIRLQEDAETVRVYACHHETSREECLTTNYVVGCDGGKSKIREQLGFLFPGRNHGSGFIMVDATISWSDDLSSVHYFVSDDAFLILIPLSGNKHRLIIRTPNNENEKVNGDKLAVYQNLVKQYGPLDLTLHDIIWESKTTYYNRLSDHYGQGRVWLAGDACHLFSSIGGLGMNTGFQDALGLAWRLAGLLKGRFHETVLESYELERRALVQQLIGRTNEMTAMITRVNRDPVALRDWLPIMANRDRLATILPLHFSGLSQRYEKGLLVESSESLIGQLIPYFALTDQEIYLSSYDFIDGSYFYLLHGDTLSDETFWPHYKKWIKPIQFQADDWQQVTRSLGLQTDEAVLIRPDGIVAAKATIQNTRKTFFPILKQIIKE
jgi:2-polyprenyl-6-methoxyphenol hydroxylase-like FAD-dependent oxidoreductase